MKGHDSCYFGSLVALARHVYLRLRRRLTARVLPAVSTCDITTAQRVLYPLR